jgi:hypothetical protein
MDAVREECLRALTAAAVSTRREAAWPRFRCPADAGGAAAAKKRVNLARPGA